MVGWDKGIAEIIDNISQKVNEANKVYLFRSMLSSKIEQVSSPQYDMKNRSELLSDAKDSSTPHEKETEVRKMEAIESVIQENHVLKKENDMLKKQNDMLKKENDMLKKNLETVQSAND